MKNFSVKEFYYILFIIVFPFLLFSPFFLGFLQGDEVGIWGNISVLKKHLIGHDYTTIDPNAGFTTEALGRQAISQIFHGDVPWWNHYEGVGFPLAGEVQSAALFPFILLMALPCGFILFQVVLQVIAGLATFQLIKKYLDCSLLAAFIAGILFEFNGTFSWLRNAAYNPIAFLPVVLLGIETLRAAVLANTSLKWGSVWVILGISGSLYAGFPEVAYLDGLLCLAWCIVRGACLQRECRISFFWGVVRAGIIALAISAPFLIAMCDFFSESYVGPNHDGSLEDNLSILPKYLVALVVPYVMGSIFRYSEFSSFWGPVGGYLGIIPCLLAYLGGFGAAYRHLKRFLLGWLIVCLAAAYGFPYLIGFLRVVVPGIKYVAFYRYILPSCEMAVAVMAAFGLMNLSSMTFVKKHIRIVLIIPVLFVGISMIILFWDVDYSKNYFSFVSLFLFLALLALFFVFISWLKGNKRCIAISSICIFEAIVLFTLPVLGHYTKNILDMQGVSYLQKHIGNGRFFSFGPISPNYGSFYNIASINHNDLPVPERWVRFIHTHIDPKADPITFIGDAFLTPSLQENFIRHQDAFKEIGVQYVVVPRDSELQDQSYKVIRDYLSTSKDMRLVYQGGAMKIYRLPSSFSYAEAPNCSLVIKDKDHFEANCREPSNLVRKELFMRGWHARVNKVSSPVLEEGELFQKISLPVGYSEVRFTFRPPYMRVGYAFLLIGSILLAYDFCIAVWQSSRKRFSFR